MYAATELVLSAHRSKLKQGAVLVNPNDDGVEVRILFMVEHSIREAQKSTAPPKEASRRLEFVEINEQGNASRAGWAPHLTLSRLTRASES